MVAQSEDFAWALRSQIEPQRGEGLLLVPVTAYARNGRVYTASGKYVGDEPRDGVAPGMRDLEVQLVGAAWDPGLKDGPVYSVQALQVVDHAGKRGIPNLAMHLAVRAEVPQGIALALGVQMWPSSLKRDIYTTDGEVGNAELKLLQESPTTGNRLVALELSKPRQFTRAGLDNLIVAAVGPALATYKR